MKISQHLRKSIYCRSIQGYQWWRDAAAWKALHEGQALHPLQCWVPWVGGPFPWAVSFPREDPSSSQDREQPHSNGHWWVWRDDPPWCQHGGGEPAPTAAAEAAPPWGIWGWWWWRRWFLHASGPVCSAVRRFQRWPSLECIQSVQLPAANYGCNEFGFTCFR